MWYVILALVIALAIAVKFSFDEKPVAKKASTFFIIGFIVVVILSILAGG